MPDAIYKLHKGKVELVMLTGESRTTSKAVAKKPGIDNVFAEVPRGQEA